MNTLPDAICPLCSQVFPQARLYEHIISERAQLRQNTILVIQAYHASWVEGHGACESCWKSYRDAGRVLDLLKTNRPQNQRFSMGDHPRPDLPARNPAANTVYEDPR